MTSLLEGAPAGSASESPAVAPSGVGCSEAMIVACVLADLCGPHRLHHHRLDDRVRRALELHRHAHFLTWYERVEVRMRAVVWDSARQAAAALYPTLRGVGDLPDFYRAGFGAD